MLENLPEFPSELEWQIDRRSRIQQLLFRFYDFLDRHAEFPHEELDCRIKMAWMVDAGFSLWRSAFLTRAARDNQTIHDHTKEFLQKLLEMNAITFADDHRLRSLTVGYYNANARYRIRRLFTTNPPLLELETCQAVAKLTGDLASERQSRLWDLYYLALLDCFDWFKDDWFATMRPKRAAAPGA